MSEIEAVVVDPSAKGRLVIQGVPAPQPLPNEALVRTAATSLNLGEVRRSLTMASAGFRPGWDVAGMVEEAAVDGSSPAVGSRVVGMLPSGAWAQQVAVPSHALAELPEEVSFAEASTLPIAGLTALYALEIYGPLLGRNVLITGASGGVGHLGIQLAKRGGALVVASVRRAEREALARQAGADEVVTGEDLGPATKYGRYDCILESVGGPVLGAALGMLRPDGMCINYGNSAGGTSSFDVSPFFRTGGARLYGFIVFHELKRWPAREGLGRLVEMVRKGVLVPPIEREGRWRELPALAKELWDRKIGGKAVVHMT